MDRSFGAYVRQRREELLAAGDRKYTLRQVSARLGIQPSYLSRIENGKVDTGLSEENVKLLAADLGEDADVMLSLAGKVASDLQYIIRERPVIYGRLIRTLSDEPDEALHYVIDQAEQGTLPGRE